MTSIPALFELIEKDLGDILEGEFSRPVVLKTPEGAIIDKAADGSPLRGYVRFSYADARDVRGEKDKVIVNAPAVRLRKSSLPRVPVTGEKWEAGVSGEWYGLNGKKHVEASGDTVKLFLAKMRGA